MGKYLNFDTALQRLLDEYQEHGQIVVAYDFDDTVCTYTKGNPQPTLERPANEEVCQLLRELRPYAKFVVWTCRSSERNKWEPHGQALDLALQWLRNHNVPYDHVNEDTVVSYGSRKIYANIFLDDRAGLASAFAMLQMFLEIVRSQKRFNPMNAHKAIVQSIRQYAAEQGGDRVIIGMSGGADSTICGALCVEALGATRVLGVIMPNGHQGDIQDAIDVCEELGIQYVIVNIAPQVDQMMKDLGFKDGWDFAPEMLKNNLPALVRRNVLMAIKLTHSGRIINTTNQSEEFLGWITQGDNIVGDFAPIINYTKTEVVKIGLTLPVSQKWIIKVPYDGMCGATDEEKFGFTYEQLDFIIGAIPENNPVFLGICEDELQRIFKMHQASQFKREPLASAPHVN